MCSRCSFLAAPVLGALLVLFLAAASQAQVSAGGDTIRGTASLEATLVAGATGDPALSGDADLVVSPRRGAICFDIELDVDGALGEAEGADTVVSVHIHPGTAGVACEGEDCPAPIDLDFANEGLEGCAKAGKQLLSSLVAEPEQFFLHVHTARFPTGALSGQLRDRDDDE